METRELSKLKSNPQNPRGAVEHDAALRELAMSIQSLGVLQPIIITPNDNIVAGHRRVEAAKLAGLESVPVIVKKLTQLEQLEMMLVENLQRADLDVLQEGAAFKLLIGYGLTVSQISKAIGVSSARVSDCMAIQDLPVDVQRQFAWGALPVSCAGVLAALPTPSEQARWTEEAVKQKWTGVALRKAIHKPERRNGNHSKPSTKPSGPRFLRDMIGQLESMDEQLDEFPDCRAIQSLLRQATSQMIDKVQEQRRAARAA